MDGQAGTGDGLVGGGRQQDAVRRIQGCPVPVRDAIPRLMVCVAIVAPCNPMVGRVQGWMPTVCITNITPYSLIDDGRRASGSKEQGGCRQYV